MAKKKLKYLVIHCTATPEGMEVTPEMIRAWHTLPPPRGRGWDRVGYSKLIKLDGIVHSFVDENDDEFVDPWEVTYGVKGINSVSRHICYAGGLDKKLIAKDTRNPLQILSLTEVVKIHVKNYPEIKVAGHYHFDARECPCFDVEEWLRSIGIPEKNIYSKKK